MKKIIFSIIALTVCALLLAFTLCACGEKAQTTETTAASQAADTAETTAANNDTPAETTAAASNVDASASPLVGSWEYETGGFIYTFNADGTGSYDAAGNVMEFTYVDHGDSVEILYTGNTLATTSEYRIEGNAFIIKDALDKDVKYIKK